MNQNKKFTAYTTSLVPKAQELRKNMTRHERHLWYDFLRNYPVKFYRQRPIDSYIADFYCAKAKLVIELDGSQHYTKEGKEYDFCRSNTLKKYGLKVLRISNTELDRNFDNVCSMIDKMVKNQIKLCQNRNGDRA